MIYRKARELLEERGIRAGYLATGMARWDELFLQPAAPVLLRGLTITPTRARHDDFDLALDDEPEVNPVLLHKLASVYGAATDKLADQRGDRLYALLTAAARGRRGARVRDHRQEGDRHVHLRQAAHGPRPAERGGTAGRQRRRRRHRRSIPTRRNCCPPTTTRRRLLDSPEADYSVLDADSSQRSAIAAVLSGRSLVIHGPPGTGKSQTIANLTAALVARGRKVLFVAEKRAAIDAVLSRLKGVDLGELVLDIHEGTRDRQRIARDLGASLDIAQQTATPDDTSLRRRLAERQRRLSDHVTALHEAHPPWGLTPFAVQSALLGIPDAARNPVRLPAPERITGTRADEIRDELREFAHLGGFAMRPGSTPWFGAALRTPEDARTRCHLAARLSTYDLPRLHRPARQGQRGLGLRPPASYAEALARISLYAGIGQTTAVLDRRGLRRGSAGTGRGHGGHRQRFHGRAATAAQETRSGSTRARASQRARSWPRRSPQPASSWPSGSEPGT